ncbi:MAG: YicC/YloC family endoribonuclease, partial [Burkholderiaceae bacterium]
MTGYAVSNRDSDSGSITLEIRSVNSRFLDLQFRINDDLRMLEPMLREAISARVSRGKVECRLSFGRKERTASLAANDELLSALQSAQQSVLTRFPEARPLSVNELLRWPGVLHEAELSQDSLQGDVQATLKVALEAF